MDAERTRPPESALRFATPAELYAAMPELAELTQARPRASESHIEYLSRLAASTTPEEAVTFTAFAIRPRQAIWWAHDCLRQLSQGMGADEAGLMHRVAEWLDAPTTWSRQILMQEALWFPSRTPVVYLALATGWSGGPVAPNDLTRTPPALCPRTLNSAVLSALARSGLAERSVNLAQIISTAQATLRRCEGGR